MLVSKMKKAEFIRLILNLQEIAHEMNEMKQEEEEKEGNENEKKKN